jgi:hypothetical protein
MTTSFGTVRGVVGFQRRGGVKGGDGDSDISDEAKEALQVIRFLITEVVSYGDDGDDEDGDLENFEAEVEFLATPPGHDDDKRGVQHGGLDGGADAVRESEVDLVVPGLVESCQVLGGLFDEWDQDETHERIRDAGLFHDWFDLVDEGDGDEGHKGDGDGERDDAFGEREFRLRPVFMGVDISLLVVFEDGVVDTVVRLRLEKDEDNVCDNEEHSNDSRYMKGSTIEIIHCYAVILNNDAVLEDAWDSESKASHKKQTSSNLADGRIEGRRPVSYASRKETKSQTEQHSSQDRSQNSSSDNVKPILVLGAEKEDKEEDDLDDGADSSFGQDAQQVWHLPGQLGTRKPNHIGTGDHGNVRKTEPKSRRADARKIDGESSRYKGP